MNLKIAIQADEVVHHNGERQSFSERWIELAESQGIDTVVVDVFSPEIMPKISASDAFMWRCPPTAHPRLYAKRLLYAIESGMGKPVFPSLKTWWHFEDKIGQYYFFFAAGIPTPATHVAWSREEAIEFCKAGSYPMVLKLAIGYQSSNVRLVRNCAEALFYVDEMFNGGVVSLGYHPAASGRRFLRRLRAAAQTVRGRNVCGSTAAAEAQYGYLLTQEFLPDNGFDVRVTIIGDRAFAFRRFNRPGDFRASGSGRIDWNPQQINEDAIRLAYRVARQMDAQTVAVDILRRGAEPVIVELTLTYASWAVRDCPGHWILHGAPESGALEWTQGSMRPEDAIFTDFVAQICHSTSAAGPVVNV